MTIENSIDKKIINVIAILVTTLSIFNIYNILSIQTNENFKIDNDIDILKTETLKHITTNTILNKRKFYFNDLSQFKHTGEETEIFIEKDYDFSIIKERLEFELQDNTINPLIVNIKEFKTRELLGKIYIDGNNYNFYIKNLNLLDLKK